MVEVILRCINNNNKTFDLNVTGTPDLSLDISSIEIGEIGQVFGISSQTFSIAGDDNSNKFFNNIFDLGITPAVALNKSVPCQVLVDGQQVFNGKLYIQDIISDDWNDVIYNCVITNEIIDFKTLTENLGLEELAWGKYNHPYNYTSISQSWNDTLFSGSIFYPLINYGADPQDPKSPQFEFGGNTYQLDNPNTPLKISQFKPAIKAKTIVDEIFNKINYKYTSSFFNSTLFENLYQLSTVDNQSGVPIVSSNSGSYVWASVTQSFDSGFTTLNYSRLLFDTAEFNYGNNYNLSGDSYTADYTGAHTFNLQIPFNITSNFGPLQKSRRNRQVILLITKSTSLTAGNILHTNKTPIPNSTSGKINTGTISLDLKQGDIIYFYISLQSPSSNGLEKFTTVITAGNNGVYLKVRTPNNPVGGTVNVGKIFGESKSLDFIKGLNEKFNLIIEPTKEDSSILKIEPYNDWINLGKVVDWTSKVDRSVKYSITHPITQLPKSFRFSDDIDEDGLNQFVLTNYQKTYGEFTYTTDSDLAEGERQIGGYFAATPVKQLPVKGTNGTTVVPWLVKQEPGKYVEPISFKPRLLHKTPIKEIPSNEMFGQVSGSYTPPTGVNSFYYIDDPDTSSVRALHYYRTLLPVTDSPTNFSSSLDLHYTNQGYWPFQQSAVNGQCQDGLFNRYWAYYINSLYDIDARILTCNIVFNPLDLNNISLNDKIFIDGHYWRINKIIGYDLINTKSTQVELIKILPGLLPFTGRRRVTTGLLPGEFIDVIQGGTDQGGNVRYVNFETGETIGDSEILDIAASLDGLQSINGQVVWNNQKTPDYNPKVWVLGNSKFNETQDTVFVAGGGNVLPDNLESSFILGSNNNLTLGFTGSISESYSGVNNITVIGSDITIQDSVDIIIIKPSGSFEVSGSTNNVIINPIASISELDPTGSVYTGNLINQGTANFKQGQSVTGSVDISGSLTINGVEYPFGYFSGYSTLTQTASMDLVGFPITLNNTISSASISLISGSQITFDRPGTYDIQFSAQLDRTHSGNTNFWVWLKRNGNNENHTNMRWTLSGGANSRTVATLNYFLDISNSNDYIELYWATDQSAYAQLRAENVATVGPEIPSVIVTVNQIR
jgi:hypothetical protein